MSLSTNPEPLLLSSMPHETASYAKRKGINVLAELDVPRHAESWGAGYLALWPSNNCTQPLDISRDFTSFFIDGVLSGAFVSLIQAISLIYSENVLSLANYNVYAMSTNVSFAVAPPTVTMESILSIYNQRHTKIDSLLIKMFEVNSGGKTTSVGGINGGGGKSRPAASGIDGGESFDWNLAHVGASVSGQETNEGEFGKWKSLVEEADNITELLYKMILSEEPNNPLLLANYAQFLYIVAQDYESQHLHDTPIPCNPTSVQPWAQEFDAWFKEAPIYGRYQDVDDYNEKAPQETVAWCLFRLIYRWWMEGCSGMEATTVAVAGCGGGGGSASGGE
ncbi:hypothetical protein Tco_0988553 [Tanacetum coccineum]|uniref:Beta-N-acetylhexosaminidase n=1 Tax=Tanacetum coccineum TaxID=301880 RepID=A0ABQ5ERL8_9ASTR